MTQRTKLLLSALTTILALSFAVSTATASRSLSIEGGVTERNGGVQLTLTGRVTFENRANGNIICNTTFTKTVSRVIPKIEGTLIGRVTRVDIERFERCGGTARLIAAVRVLNETAAELWRIIYKRFLGELPEITGLLFLLTNTQVLLSFELLGLRFFCLYENGRLPETIGVLARVERKTIKELRTLNERREQLGTDLIRQLPESTGICPSKGEFRAEVNPTGVVRIVLL